jgi:hypothetical protein
MLGEAGRSNRTIQIVHSMLTDRARDINNDNIVNIFDIVVVALHFGETS